MPSSDICRLVVSMLLVLTGAVLSTSGCAGEDPRVASRELSESEIAELAEEYPVLREERAPEPDPDGDATPAEIPRAVRQALTKGVLESISGEATFYADRFEGRRTASGIPFRQNQMVAAHRSYPFGTLLQVTNERNGRSVHVRVVDRGPFGSAAKQRKTVIDLSRRAAEELDFISAGRTAVKVEVLEWGEGLPAI